MLAKFTVSGIELLIMEGSTKNIENVRLTQYWELWGPVSWTVQT
jgi:hypothetical protein